MAYRAQAAALEIENMAKRRLADEYDAAQERGEVASKGKPVNVPDGNIKPTVEDIGLTRNYIHEAPQARDAEQAEPGIVRRALDARMPGILSGPKGRRGKAGSYRGKPEARCSA